MTKYMTANLSYRVKMQRNPLSLQRIDFTSLRILYNSLLFGAKNTLHPPVNCHELRTGIKDGRKLTPSAQDAVRRKAVLAVVSGSMTQTAAAEVFGVTRVSVCIWVNAYRKKGEAALQSKRKGRPCGGKLTKAQEVFIHKSVLEKHPGQFSLPGLLWTRDLVSELIKRRFGISLSRWTVGRYLKKWGIRSRLT